jgi:jumonji domain-containing protein 2
MGVNTPYVYIGSWKTMFGWHKEDMDLFSINYLHYGKPKFWYGIEIDDNEKFENFLKSKFPDYFRECPEFLRHKTTLVYPGILKDCGIKVRKMAHK